MIPSLLFLGNEAEKEKISSAAKILYLAAENLTQLLEVCTKKPQKNNEFDETTKQTNGDN